MQEKALAQIINSLTFEIRLPASSIHVVIALLNEGNTIPFIARYRKEATGNLDEVQIKNIHDRYIYLQELEERRQTILTSIESQGKLTEELRSKIDACQIKTTLEDLYLPYKPKRRTRAMIAREKGLEPLADLIFQQPLTPLPESAAMNFLNEEKGVDDSTFALSGARDIVAERIAENASIRSIVRDAYITDGIIVSQVKNDKISDASKYEQYYNFKESVKSIPSHRYLAIRRGEKEEILSYSIEINPEPVICQIQTFLKLNCLSPFSAHLEQAIEDSFKRLLCPSIETDVRLELKNQADHSAVEVFAENLKHLLLASPLGEKVVLGIDPGIRTGCKCAVIDQTGKFLESVTIYLSQGESEQLKAKRSLKHLIDTYQPIAIGVGNGTGGKETESFVRQFLKEVALTHLYVVSVNEAGASVYSASEEARDEFPNLDVTIRGAISIARRLQDPLAELVKIDPKSIGVGQYQHDVQQSLLHKELQYIVESCVNHVGVDLNTASVSLLTYVSGIGPSLARKIVQHRETLGVFKSRIQLNEITGFGSKTFEQAAGFLRIRNGSHPLDASAVHPERYPFVEQMAADLTLSLKEFIFHPTLSDLIDFKHYSQIIGEHTLADIIQELKKPGRDPRASFESLVFREDLNSLENLKVGMKLEGIVTNVTAFGAFVDIGVHQDGLVHKSELSDKFIKHPSEVINVGKKIKVEVIGIDIKRRRISLSSRIGQKEFDNQSNKNEKINKKNEKVFYSNPFSSL